MNDESNEIEQECNDRLSCWDYHGHYLRPEPVVRDAVDAGGGVGLLHPLLPLPDCGGVVRCFSDADKTDF